MIVNIQECKKRACILWQWIWPVSKVCFCYLLHYVYNIFSEFRAKHHWWQQILCKQLLAKFHLLKNVWTRIYVTHVSNILYSIMLQAVNSFHLSNWMAPSFFFFQFFFISICELALYTNHANGYKHLFCHVYNLAGCFIISGL